MQKIGELEDLPAQSRKKVGAKVKYPWATMKPGQWFRFADNVQPMSAKQMASLVSRQMLIRLKVFRGEDGLMYCQRIDGLRVREEDLVFDSKKIHPEAYGSKDPKTVPKPMFDDEVLITDIKEAPSKGWKETP